MSLPSEPIRCPACGSGMTRQPGAPIELDRCVTCGGIWFDSGELRLWLRERFPTRRIRLSLGRGGARSAQSCPRCASRQLHRRTVHQVEVQVCTNCHGVLIPAGQEPRLADRLSKKPSFFDSSTWSVIEVVGQFLLEAGS